jgi:hypothetical protein
MDDQLDTSTALAERFEQLPKVVQDAITSADVQQHLRDLAHTHKLHVDQWQLLENVVMMTLLGFKAVAELTDNIQNDVGVEHEVAEELSKAVSEHVFAPIRAEMERSLDHPTAVQEAEGAVEGVRTQALADEATENAPAATVTTPKTPAVEPATPPAPPPTEKAVRGSIAQAYTESASHERKTIEGDPYREPIA